MRSFSSFCERTFMRLSLHQLALRARAIDYWHYGEPEIRLLPILVDPNRVSVDIGAAGGQYAWHLLRLSRRVIAFEPNPESVRHLRAAVPRLDVRQLAVSSRSGVAELRVPVSGRVTASGWGTIHPTNHFSEISPESVQSIQVDRVRLDDQNLGDVGFIKIDVEGHELEVLQGARALLLRRRPNLLIEVSGNTRGNDSSSLLAVLSELGYVKLRLRQGRVLEQCTQMRDPDATEGIFAIANEPVMPE